MSTSQVVALLFGAGILALLVGLFIGWMVREMGWREAVAAFAFAVGVLGIVLVAAGLISYGATGEWS